MATLLSAVHEVPLQVLLHGGLVLELVRLRCPRLSLRVARCEEAQLAVLRMREYTGLHGTSLRSLVLAPYPFDLPYGPTAPTALRHTRALWRP